MIVGNGDIAKALASVDRDDRLFFASGVSNSRCEDEMEYEREIELLSQQNNGFHIVYFSTLALYYGDSRYVNHKWQMETLVKEWFPKWTIVRFGNITWGTNPHTIINYLRAHPKAPIRDEFRYIIDKEEFLYWVNMIPDWNDTMNITGRRMTIKQIKEEYCE